MKHFRITVCFLAVASAALLLTALGRRSVDPDQVGRRVVPVPQVQPESAAAAPAPRESNREAVASEQGTASPALTASTSASDPANGDDDPRHPGDRVDAATIVRRYGNQPLTTTHPAIATVMEVQERNNRWLLANPAVVGTAVGLNDQADVAIIVYTKVDAPELPKAIEGVPVAVWRSGEFTARLRTQEETLKVKGDGNARAKGNGGKPGTGTTVDPTAKFRPVVPIGVSLGHPDITAGTLGCRVKNGDGVYALSNNHVLANENNAEIGDNALQPGPYDGGQEPTDAIATLHAFAPIKFGSGEANNNTIDAAIAKDLGANIGNATPENAGYGIPKSMTLPAAVGTPVKKYGRTTKLTTSKVSALNGTVRVGYDGGTATFVGQVIIGGAKFSAGGDSGSLIVANGGADDRKPVGLLFAGSVTSTIANPIDVVLSSLGVVIDGE